MIRTLLLVALVSSSAFAAQATDSDVIREMIEQINQGQSNEALAKVEALIAKQGPSAQLLWVKGEALQIGGDFIAAGEAYSESIKLNPNQIESYYGRARASIQYGSLARKNNQLEVSQKALLRAIEDASKLSPGRSRSSLMAQACGLLDRKLETVRHLNDLIEHVKSDSKGLAKVYAWRASSLDVLFAHDLAARDLLASCRIDPQVTPLGKVLDAFNDAHCFDDMFQIMDELVAKGHEDTRLLRDRFLYMGKAGRMEEAVYGLEDLKSKSTDPEAIKGIDLCLASLEEHHEQLLQPVPDEINQKISEAKRQLEAGSLDKAVSIAYEAVTAAPQCVEARLIAGSALLRQKKYELAIPILTTAIKYGSKPAHEERGFALREAGLVKNSEFDLKVACKDTTNPNLPFCLADALQEKGQFKEAVDAYDHAERLGYPNADKELNAFRGYCLWRAGENQKALADLEIALDAKESVNLRMTTATIYEELGRLSEAKSSYVRVKALLSQPGTDLGSTSEAERQSFLAIADVRIGLIDLFGELQTKMETFVGLDEEKAQQQSASYAPTLEVCQAVFEDEFANLAAAKYVEAWQSGSVVITNGSPANTGVLVDATTTDGIIGGNHFFAGGWDKVAKHLRPGIRMFQVRFVEPGQTNGMRFEGFVKFKDRWYLLPKPWRVIPTDQPELADAKSTHPSSTHNGIRVGVAFESDPQQVSGAGKEPHEEKHVFVLGNSDGVLMFAIDEFPNMDVSLDRCIDVFSKVISGKVTQKSVIELEPDAITGRKVDFAFSANGGGVARSKFYLVGNRWIHVVAMGGKQFVDSQKATDFLDSVVIEELKTN